MSKRDLFVIIYCCSWGILGILLLFVNNFIFNFISTNLLVLMFQISFLIITASFVLIKPIGNWVDKYIINKLP